MQSNHKCVGVWELVGGGGGILPIAPENYAWKMVTKLVDVLAPLQLSGIDLE